MGEAAFVLDIGSDPLVGSDRVVAEEVGISETATASEPPGVSGDTPCVLRPSPIRESATSATPTDVAAPTSHAALLARAVRTFGCTTPTFAPAGISEG